MDNSDDSDQEITGNEYEELCRNCDRLCQKLADPVLSRTPRFKKDSRVWLHKNPGFKHEIKSNMDTDDTSDCLYSVMDMFGRKFKKDSRVWLHKSSRKRQRSAISNESKGSDTNKTVKYENDPLSETLNELPTWQGLKTENDNPPSECNKLCFRAFLKRNNDINKSNIHPSSIIRRRKRRRLVSCSVNNSPNEFRYNAEICRILSAELNDNRITPVRGAVSEEMFELFEDEEDYAVCETADHTHSNFKWREACVITSDTSTQSSNDNQQHNINQSPLSSDASINLSSEIQNVKRSPTLTSTATNFYGHFPLKSSSLPVNSNDQINLKFDKTPPGSPWSTVNSSTNFSDNNCPIQNGRLLIDTRKLNMNSRSVCFLIAESDEFVAETNFSDYEEESDE